MSSAAAKFQPVFGVCRKYTALGVPTPCRTVTGTSPQPTVIRWWNITITLRLAFLCTWGICVSLHTSVFGPVSQSFPETYFWPPPAGGHPNKSTKSNRVSGFAEDFLGLPEVTGAPESINSSARYFFGFINSADDFFFGFINSPEDFFSDL